MMGRSFDPRVGYFTQRFENYAAPTTWMDQQQHIARFRLEKKDPRRGGLRARPADRLLRQP